MPCTFSHPLAVVPLRRFCPERLNFSALVIGSMSPDFGYYVRQFRLAGFAHTMLGSFAVCLPSGLLAVGLFYLLRQPLCFILPQPHRAAVMPLALRQPAFSLSAFLVTAVCVLLGAWTHSIWDSFTHDGGWAVQHFAVLRVSIVHAGVTALPLSYVLQQASTFGAGALLVVLYLRWLRRQRRASEPESVSDRWRYVLVAVCALVAVAFAVPAAHRLASVFEGYLAFRVFVFRTGVYSAGVFISLLVFSSVVLYVVHRRST